MKQPKQCLTRTVDEVAEILGINRGGAYAAVNAGEIPSIKIGKRILVPIAALEKMLAGKSAA
jgi:excisionase family DNA binding protein